MRPRKTVNKHGTATVRIIIVMLKSVININSGVFYPDIRSSIYGKIHALWINVLSTHLWVYDVSEADVVLREDT